MHIYEYFSRDGVLRSLLAAVNKDGFVLPACKLVESDEGGVNDDILWTWAVQNLSPVLNRFDDRLLPNSIVMLDNAIIHHQPRFVRMLQDIGCWVFWLSPYSPDFSAIEPCFHQVKTWLKRVDPRQDRGLSLATALSCVTPQNMRGYFRKCGYPLEDAKAEKDEAIGVILCSAAAQALAAKGLLE